MARRTSAAAEQRPPSNRELQRRVAAIKAIPPPAPVMFSPEAAAALREATGVQASGEAGYVAPAQVSDEHLARLEALLREQLLAVRCDLHQVRLRRGA